MTLMVMIFCDGNDIMCDGNNASYSECAQQIHPDLNNQEE